jgi:hypothetical protein
MSGDFEMPILGIVAGYITYYIQIIYPSNNNGRKLIPTPLFLEKAFADNSGIHGMNGPEQTKQPTAGSTWGRGRKLNS